MSRRPRSEDPEQRRNLTMKRSKERTSQKHRDNLEGRARDANGRLLPKEARCDEA